MMARRRPTCGAEAEHEPHVAHHDHKPDGTVIGERPNPGYCSGWTPAEHDACLMLAQIEAAVLERVPPGTDPAGVLRVEMNPLVQIHLASLFLPGGRADMLFGCDILVCASLPAGAWRLVVPGPVLAQGQIRS